MDMCPSFHDIFWIFHMPILLVSLWQILATNLLLAEMVLGKLSAKKITSSNTEEEGENGYWEASSTKERNSTIQGKMINNLEE